MKSELSPCPTTNIHDWDSTVRHLTPAGAALLESQGGKCQMGWPNPIHSAANQLLPGEETDRQGSQETCSLFRQESVALQPRYCTSDGQGAITASCTRWNEQL